MSSLVRFPKGSLVRLKDPTGPCRDSKGEPSFDSVNHPHALLMSVLSDVDHEGDVLVEFQNLTGYVDAEILERGELEPLHLGDQVVPTPGERMYRDLHGFMTVSLSGADWVNRGGNPGTIVSGPDSRGNVEIAVQTVAGNTVRVLLHRNYVQKTTATGGSPSMAELRQSFQALSAALSAMGEAIATFEKNWSTTS